MEMLILLDYRSQFYSSTRSRGASLDVSKLHSGFEQMGYTVSVKQFAEIDLQTENYKGVIILYQSSEDSQLFYKDYIEDVLFGLFLQGAELIPGLVHFRTHHNKVFMEIFRDVVGDAKSQVFSSQSFGTYEEYQKFFIPKTFPMVLKPSAGSRSKGVVIAHNKKEADRHARKLSATPSLFNFVLGCKNLVDRRGFTPISNNRRKFIIQPFIPNLSGDYKIVIYDKKYFVLFRENRLHDFRASGSGRLSFPETVPQDVLSYARRVFENFKVPLASLDIGYDGETCYLFEFQFVPFGTYAVEKSSWYFYWNENKWDRIEKRSIVEDEFVLSTHSYIQKRKEKISAS